MSYGNNGYEFQRNNGKGPVFRAKGQEPIAIEKDRCYFICKDDKGYVPLDNLSKKEGIIAILQTTTGNQNSHKNDRLGAFFVMPYRPFRYPRHCVSKKINQALTLKNLSKAYFDAGQTITLKGKENPEENLEFTILYF
ncbi:MAG: hypothetical protein QXD13_00015 [Candidatus Pacearchaeota archaeon]